MAIAIRFIGDLRDDVEVECSYELDGWFGDIGQFRFVVSDASTAPTDYGTATSGLFGEVNLYGAHQVTLLNGIGQRVIRFTMSNMHNSFLSGTPGDTMWVQAFPTNASGALPIATAGPFILHDAST